MAAYDSVNTAWGRPISELPPITRTEAQTACKRLYRRFMKHKYMGKIAFTSGNRRGVSMRAGHMIINPDRGWFGIIHSLSHRLHYRLHPGKPPHHHSHAFLERELIQHVARSGWLDGALKRPEKPTIPVDRKALRYAAIQRRLKTWISKRKRADTAIRKLTRQAKRYEREAIIRKCV